MDKTIAIGVRESNGNKQRPGLKLCESGHQQYSQYRFFLNDGETSLNYQEMEKLSEKDVKRILSKRETASRLNDALLIGGWLIGR